jgi:predicted  nucleic acid-binding Zn-ribbon protein
MVGGKEIVTMATLEEELRALKGALSVMQSRHLADVQQLSERIDALQRQLDKQQKLISGPGQSMQQLEKAFIYQFNTLNQYINTRFDAQDASIKARFDEQMTAIRAQFENTNMQLTRIIGLVDFQEKDIREIKADVGIIKEHLDSVDQRMEGGFEAIDKRFGQLGGRVDTLEQGMNARFEQVDQRFEATNQQIAEIRQDMNSRFEQVDQRFEATNQQIAEVRQDMNSRFEQVDQRFEATNQQIAEIRQDMNSRFDAQGQILNQILERLSQQQ